MNKLFLVLPLIVLLSCSSNKDAMSSSQNDQNNTQKTSDQKQTSKPHFSNGISTEKKITPTNKEPRSILDSNKVKKQFN